MSASRCALSALRGSISREHRIVRDRLAACEVSVTRANGAQDSEAFREAVEEALGESVSERVSIFLDDHWQDFFSLADE